MSRDRGSATVELAVALPAIIILLVSGLAAIAAVTGKLACQSAAHDAVLKAARGAPVPQGVLLDRGPENVRVTVIRGPISCSAVAAREPGLP
ncbi:TadE/TadG family type IV pilus assembly protein [Catelliglobosispora koreensis]|uniref:TadE/TadG family type IV pilus assembly protein n=1 Tax=Catelliglobosispora koreensis TaxID=129052 RepID=UPI0003785F18|nr:TadE/TadG family type IV pilus assembly protein [Catelliglobosispora koreensis]